MLAKADIIREQACSYGQRTARFAERLPLKKFAHLPERHVSFSVVAVDCFAVFYTRECCKESNGE